jgi:HNH endonuclease
MVEKSMNNTLREKIYFRDDYICQYCYKNLLDSVEDWFLTEIDHIDPKANDRDNCDNLAVACRSCNLLKVGCPLDGITDRIKKIRRIRKFIEERKEEQKEILKGLRAWIKSNKWISPRDFEKLYLTEKAHLEEALAVAEKDRIEKAEETIKDGEET